MEKPPNVPSSTPTTTTKRSSLKFKETSNNETNTASSNSSISDLAANTSAMTPTPSSTSLENSKKNHKSKSKSKPPDSQQSNVSRSRSAPLHRPMKFNAQRLGVSPQKTRAGADGQNSNTIGGDALVTVSNPLFGSGKSMASSSPSIVTSIDSNPSSPSTPTKSPSKKGQSLTRRAGSMLAVFSRSSGAGDKVEHSPASPQSARSASPRRLQIATDTIVRDDPPTTDVNNTTSDPSGATTPSNALSPKSSNSVASPSLRLSASTLGGRSLKDIQETEVKVSHSSPKAEKGDKPTSHTPRTPRNLLQSFLNIDTNRAAVMQLDTMKRPTDGKEVIVAGTLDHLIVSLADDVRFQDKEYMESFLMTHRYFVPSHILFEKLMSRFFANVTPRSVHANNTISSSRSPRSPRSTISPRDRSSTAPHVVSPRTSQLRHSSTIADNSHSTSSTLLSPTSPDQKQKGPANNLNASTSPMSTSRASESSPAAASDDQAAKDKTSLFVRLRIVNVLKKWLELVPSEFEEDAELKTIFETYVIKMKAEGGKCAEWANVLSDILQKQLEKRLRELNHKEGTHNRSGDVPVPLVPKNVKRELTFLSIDPLEFARQLTLLEHDIFRRITPSELFRKAWERNGAARAANVTALIQRFNTTSYWVASEVLSCPDGKSRQATLIRLLECLKHLNELNNYNAIMEITSGLNLAYVSRLKSDWRMVPPKLFNIFKQSLELMSPNSNWANYRRELHETSPPLVPFQGVYLTDLTFLDELPTKLDNGLINFDKMSRVGNVLVTIRNWQQQRYALERVALIQDWILARPVMSEDEMIAASKAAEPISPDAPLSVYTGEPSPEWEAAKAAEEAASRQAANSNTVEISETNYIVEFNIADLQKKKPK